MTPYNSAVFLIPKISPFNSLLQICIAGRMHFLKKFKRHVLFKLEQRTRRRKKLSLNQFFFTRWTITSVNAHGRTCKKTKVYIYLYISLYENLFENGCIYIYIYIYLAEFLKTYLKMDQNIRTESWQ